jgi:septum site-determining protein MinC
MKTGTVAIKGTRDGLLVSIGEKAEISTLKRALHEKMQLAGNFFNGARVTVDMGSRVLTADEVKQLETIICDEYGMMLVKILPQQKESVDESTNTKALNKTVIVKRTIRSGQKVRFNGSVVVLGDVNPGGEIVASKDILVMGALRGVAHAGAEGDMTSIVAAFRLQPTQLRIGDKISRSPDGELVTPGFPEVARVVDGVIYIEPYTVFCSENHL